MLTMPHDRVDVAARALESLVGVPHRQSGPNDSEDRLARLVARDEALLAEGVDCLELMVIAYDLIGRSLEEPAAWRFPVPTGYPYCDPLPAGGWMPEREVAEWSRHWRRVSDPALGTFVSFVDDHVGVIVRSSQEPPGAARVLHCHRSHGTVLQPFPRLLSQVRGLYRLLEVAP